MLTGYLSSTCQSCELLSRNGLASVVIRPGLSGSLSKQLVNLELRWCVRLSIGDTPPGSVASPRWASSYENKHDLNHQEGRST